MTGKLAFSRAGHDKGRAYLIIKEEQDTVWLADGRSRSLLAPKKKNRRHIQPAGRAFAPEEVEALLAHPAHGDNLVREAVDRFMNP